MLDITDMISGLFVIVVYVFVYPVSPRFFMNSYISNFTKTNTQYPLHTPLLYSIHLCIQLNNDATESTSLNRFTVESPNKGHFGGNAFVPYKRSSLSRRFL